MTNVFKELKKQEPQEQVCECGNKMLYAGVFEGTSTWICKCRGGAIRKIPHITGPISNFKNVIQT